MSTEPGPARPAPGAPGSLRGADGPDPVVAALRTPPAVPIAPARRPGARRVLLPLVAVVGALALVAGAVAVVDSSTDSATVTAEVEAEHLFAVEQLSDGVLAVRTWRLTGTDGDRLEATLRLENPTPQRLEGEAAEVLPSSLGDGRDEATWTPEPDDEPATGVAVFGYDLAPRGRTTVRYTVSLPADGATTERADALAQDQQEAAAAYAERTAEPPPVLLTSLAVAPTRVQLGVRRTARLTLSGTLSDGSPATPALLAGTLWTTDRPSVVLVRGGTVYGVGPGRATVTAEREGLRARVEVVVVGAPATTRPPAPAAAPRPPVVVPLPLPQVTTATARPRPATSAPRPATTRPRPATTRPRPATTAPRPATTRPSPRPTTESPRPSPRPTTASPRPTSASPRPSTPPPPDGTRYTVNDDSAGAARSGPWSVARTGYEGFSYRVATKPSGCAGAAYAAASWQARVPVTGTYRVEVFIPAEARATVPYRVRTGDGTQRVTVDQGAHQDRWYVLLGAVGLTTTSPAVLLDNALGQSGGCPAQETVGADAVRFTYLGR